MKKLPFKLPADFFRPAAFTTPLRLLLATTAALWMGAAQPQPVPASSSAGSRANGATELRFRDFFSTPIGPKGLEISERLLAADGQQVRLTGYMVQQEEPAEGYFLLTPRPVQMSEHADGEADDLPPATVVVRLDVSQRHWRVPHVRGLVSVTGTLSVGRFEEADGRVSWVRLQLQPDAVRSSDPAELAGYLHGHGKS
jgi:hypothetical protein